MSDYFIQIRREKSGVFQSLSPLALIQGDNPQLLASHAVRDYAIHRGISNVAIDLFSAQNFDSGVNKFEFARQFGKDSRGCNVIFIVTKIYDMTKEEYKNLSRYIPF